MKRCKVVTIAPGETSEYPYRTTARVIGGSVYLKLPPEVLPHHGLTELKEEDGPDAVPILIQNEEGKHGEYGSFWNQSHQDSEEDG